VPTHADYQLFKGVKLTAHSVGGKYLPPTPPDILGPFYLAGADVLQDGVLADDPNLHVAGRVLNTDGEPVPADLDIWQADENGVYDEKGYKFRGRVLADIAGNYAFHTIRPGDYKISEPGQPDDFRCAHIHVIVTAPGHKRLVTQLYFPDDRHNVTDHWFDTRRVILADGHFDFILEREV
jgi:protocatechuate 3,4-dioxygenase beta subunit